MSRLSNPTKDAIRAAAVAFAFDPKKEALLKAEDLLAREAHAFLFKQEHLAIAAKLPAVWVPKITTMKLNVGGHKIELKASEALLVPFAGKSDKVGSYYYETGVIPHGDLCDRIQAHAQACEKYREDRQAASQKLEATLRKFTTAKKLAEEWPDGKPFYEKYLNAPAPQVPAIRMDEINAMLGLPAGA